ncbi:hypothetical protein C8R44DRAFT_881074 [Mycena epipterygia]|nr:hypothetical protein C8R44DRAFT_881074 [Mycena epipterygia]
MDAFTNILSYFVADQAADAPELPTVNEDRSSGSSGSKPPEAARFCCRARWRETHIASGVLGPPSSFLTTTMSTRALSLGCPLRKTLRFFSPSLALSPEPIYAPPSPNVLYGFSLAYLVAPDTFDSVHVAEFVAGLPDAAKYAARVLRPERHPPPVVGYGQMCVF